MDCFFKTFVLSFGTVTSDKYKDLCEIRSIPFGVNKKIGLIENKKEAKISEINIPFNSKNKVIIVDRIRSLFDDITPFCIIYITGHGNKEKSHFISQHDIMKQHVQDIHVKELAEILKECIPKPCQQNLKIQLGVCEAVESNFYYNLMLELNNNSFSNTCVVGYQGIVKVEPEIPPPIPRVDTFYSLLKENNIPQQTNLKIPRTNAFNNLVQLPKQSNTNFKRTKALTDLTKLTDFSDSNIKMAAHNYFTSQVEKMNYRYFKEKFLVPSLKKVSIFELKKIESQRSKVALTIQKDWRMHKAQIETKK